MSDADATRAAESGVTSIAEIVDATEPMGDLDGFVVDDLSSDEEDEFFSILADA